MIRHPITTVHAAEIQELINRHVVAIGTADAHNVGINQVGTGCFVALGGVGVILTAHHVVAECLRRDGRVFVSAGNGMPVVWLEGSGGGRTGPEDIGMLQAPIEKLQTENGRWSRMPFVLPETVARPQLLPGDLYCILGYPGEEARFSVFAKGIVATPHAVWTEAISV